VETDALDYALAAILSIVNEDNEVHPVAFHSCTFTAVELNYDTHDKELLAIFKAFKIWQHYLEGLTYPIYISFLLNFFFFFFFFLVTMKRYMTLQSHDISHDVTS